MTDAELRGRLQATQIDNDADAEQRAWEIVRSAYGTAQASRRRRRFRINMPAFACTVAIMAIVLATASAPREALARWIRGVIDFSTQTHPRPVLGGLPGGGRLLVNSPSGPWIVRADGSRGYLGPYTAAAWSPHGLYVVAWRGAELAALDPYGHVQWALSTGAKVTVARWSPDGYRIAYIAGGSLHIVAGDGSDSHRLDSLVDPVAPAWQPRTGQAHRIAFVDHLGDIELRNADTLALHWRIKPVAAPRELLWSPNGTRLLTVAARQLSIYNAAGRLIATETIPSGDTAGSAAFSTGDRVALILHAINQGADGVVLLDANRQGLERAPEAVFTAREQLAGIDWSPNGAWLLTSSPSADQWIFIHVLPPTRLTAISRIAGPFRRNANRAGGPLDLAGWQR